MCYLKPLPGYFLHQPTEGSSIESVPHLEMVKWLHFKRLLRDKSSQTELCLVWKWEAFIYQPMSLEVARQVSKPGNGKIYLQNISAIGGWPMASRWNVVWLNHFNISSMHPGHEKTKRNHFYCSTFFLILSAASCRGQKGDTYVPGKIEENVCYHEKHMPKQARVTRKPWSNRKQRQLITFCVKLWNWLCMANNI